MEQLKVLMPHLITLFIGGGLVWVAILQGWIGRKKLGAETKGLEVDADLKYQKLYQGAINFQTSETERFRNLYMAEMQAKNLVYETLIRKDEEIKQLRKEVQEMHTQIAQLNARLGFTDNN